MIYRIGIENNVEGRSLAWALDYPGCFAYGDNADLALAAMPRAISDYAAWGASHSYNEDWLNAQEIELLVYDEWDVYYIDDKLQRATTGRSVHAWFQHDWQPLEAEDIQSAVQLLIWGRADLMETVERLSKSALEATHPGERWNIAGIIKHIGSAEWWYMERLGLAPSGEDLPEEPFERLETTRSIFIQKLMSLAENDQVVGIDGEFWSPRKMLRRSIWHERDHTHHIRKLRS